MSEDATRSRVAASPVLRAVWVVAGLVLVGVGAVGLVVPGLPSTVFFLGAAWCFSRSHRRLERWLLGLPLVGGLIRDYRAGLGMPRAAKVTAVAVMWTAIAVSAFLLRGRPWLAASVVALGVAGTGAIGWWVPTRETVLAAREAPAGAPKEATDSTR
ncbi:MAG: YbaN family protein [Kineosporiaceae bacterium]